jgi:hypothetical protein
MAYWVIGDNDSTGDPPGGWMDAKGFPPRRCFVMGGATILTGNPRVSTGIGSGVGSVNVGTATAMEGGVVPGDTFTFAGETGSPVHTVTGLFRAVANAIAGMTFTPNTVSAVALNSAINFTSSCLMERVPPEAGGEIDGVSLGGTNGGGGGQFATPGLPVKVEASAAFAQGADLETLVDGRVKAVASGKAVLRSLQAAGGAGSIVWAVFKSGV